MDFLALLGQFASFFTSAAYANQCDKRYNQYIPFHEYSASCVVKALSSTTGWETDDYECAVGNDLSANNATGFNAMPAGRYSGNNYSDFGDYAYFWTATEDYDQYSTWAYYLNWSYYETDFHFQNETPKANKFSVRCVKDDTSGDGGGDTGCTGTHTSENVNTCESYTWHGQTYTDSGTYVFVYTNAQGCRCTETLHLTIYEPTITTTSASACESYTWHGQPYLSSGTYTYNYENEFGCASTETLNLTIYHGTHEIFSAEDCESYTWYGTSYSSSGIYTYAYTNEYGCPIYNGSFNHFGIGVDLFSVTQQENISSKVWRWYMFTQSNSAGVSRVYDLYKNQGSSVRCLKDTISSGGNPPCIGTHNVETETACGNYTWHGQTYSVSGTYTYAYTNKV